MTEENKFNVDDLKALCSNRAKIAFKVNVGEDVVNPLFYMVSLSEDKRYGYKRLELRNENGEVIKESYLSLENRIFPRKSDFGSKGISGGLKYVAVDEDGNFVNGSDTLMVDLENKELPKYDSSLHTSNNPRENEISEKIGLYDILDIDVSSVYVLFPVEGEEVKSEKLKEFLLSLENNEEPEFLTMKFCYRSSYNQNDGFLQVINDKIYLMVGTKRSVRYFEEDVEIEEIQEEDVELDLEFGF